MPPNTPLSSHGRPQIDLRFLYDMRKAIEASLACIEGEAIRQSIEDNAICKAEQARDLAVVSERLQAHGRIRLDTPRFGNCQIDAAVMTASLDMSADD